MQVCVIVKNSDTNDLHTNNYRTDPDVINGLRVEFGGIDHRHPVSCVGSHFHGAHAIDGKIHDRVPRLRIGDTQVNGRIFMTPFSAFHLQPLLTVCMDLRALAFKNSGELAGFR